jgi:hypothetical protein
MTLSMKGTSHGRKTLLCKGERLNHVVKCTVLKTVHEKTRGPSWLKPIEIVVFSVHFTFSLTLKVSYCILTYE